MKNLLIRRVGMPVWSLALLAVVFITAIGAAAGPDDETNAEVAAGSGQSNSTTTAPEATTTTAVRTTTTAPTTTTASTTTTVPAVTQQSFQNIFDGQRSAVLGVLEKDNNIETVDKFIYDAAAGVVVLDVTSRWAARENQVDGAWAITRGVAALWGPDSGPFANSFTPGFRLLNSGSRYQCDNAFMLRLAKTEAGRADWAAACR